MQICKDCQRPFDEPEIEEIDEGIPVCPFCGSEEIYTPSEYGREEE